MSDRQGFVEARRHARLKLAAMYTFIEVRSPGAAEPLSGYVYDISSSGARFELDEPLSPGAQVEVRISLPGADATEFSAVGHVVRIHDDDDAGPIRMAMTFDRFAGEADRLHLLSYLGHRGILAA